MSALRAIAGRGAAAVIPSRRRGERDHVKAEPATNQAALWVAATSDASGTEQQLRT